MLKSLHTGCYFDPPSDHGNQKAQFVNKVIKPEEPLLVGDRFTESGIRDIKRAIDKFVDKKETIGLRSSIGANKDELVFGKQPTETINREGKF